MNVVIIQTLTIRAFSVALSDYFVFLVSLNLSHCLAQSWFYLHDDDDDDRD